MRTTHVVPLLLLSTALAAGCAITNYELITDNDQVSNGNGSGVVNTNGKALIRQSSLVATQWPDGTDVSVCFVDQRANGDRTLTTYNNFSTGDDPIFQSDLYCSPDRQGCAIFTSDDPEVGDIDIFDYSFNTECSGARSISDLISTSRYYGECGRLVPSLEDRLSLLYQAQHATWRGVEALSWSVSPANLTIVLDNLEGGRARIPLTGEARVIALAGGERHAVLDLSNPALRATGNAYADWALTQARHENEVTFTYAGLEFRKRFGIVRDPGKTIRNLVNARY